MVTQEQNDALTQTGPETIMGGLFRRYWIPALHDWELAEPDSPPVRIKLLGHRLPCLIQSRERHLRRPEVAAEERHRARGIHRDVELHRDQLRFNVFEARRPGARAP